MMVQPARTTLAAAPPATRSRCCPNCNGEAGAGLPFGREGWRTVACTACGFVYMPEVPDHDAVATTFEWSQSFAAEAARRKRASPLLARLDEITRVRTRIFGRRNPMQDVRRHIAGGRVVDLGCGNGSYLASAGQGYSLFGIDISPALTAQADTLFREHGGYAICAPAARVCAASNRASSTRRSCAPISSTSPSRRRPRQPVHGAAPGWRRRGEGPELLVAEQAAARREVVRVPLPRPRQLLHAGHTAGDGRAPWLPRRHAVEGRLPTDDNMWAVLHRPA